MFCHKITPYWRLLTESTVGGLRPPRCVQRRNSDHVWSSFATFSLLDWKLLPGKKRKPGGTDGWVVAMRRPLILFHSKKLKERQQSRTCVCVCNGNSLAPWSQRQKQTNNWSTPWSRFLPLQQQLLLSVPTKSCRSLPTYSIRFALCSLNPVWAIEANNYIQIIKSTWIKKKKKCSSCPLLARRQHNATLCPSDFSFWSA